MLAIGILSRDPVLASELPGRPSGGIAVVAINEDLDTVVLPSIAILGISGCAIFLQRAVPHAHGYIEVLAVITDVNPEALIVIIRWRRSDTDDTPQHTV